ncbi:MAG TPA: sensor histidine kinase [Pilimelia sp.]|nr:sensor histidine kinase [Pilimelia sp.]
MVEAVARGARPQPPATPTPFHHVGLLYRDQTEYRRAVTSFVRAGLAAGDPVLVAVPGARLDLLRAALSDVSDRVRFADMARAGRNPGRILPGVLLAFAAAHPGRRAWIVGEPIWPGRTEVEYPACVAHEALINDAFAGRDAAILCPYDADNLDHAALADAQHTHPTMLDGDGLRPSPAYLPSVAARALYNVPLPAAPPDAATMSYHGEWELAAVRRFVTAEAAATGLGADRADDLAIAVNELAANTVEHTGGAGRVRIWREPGLLVCQIEDKGYLRDPLAGRVPPPPDTEGGRGLILANQLCDLVRIHTGAEGTRIRLHIDR